MKDYFGYKDKVCVVTGAASGIGRSTVDLLLDMGAVVYAIDIKDIEIPGVKNFIAADLNSKDAIDMAFEEIPKQIDCFFGIAGQLKYIPHRTIFQCTLHPRSTFVLTDILPL